MRVLSGTLFPFSEHRFGRSYLVSVDCLGLPLQDSLIFFICECTSQPFFHLHLAKRIGNLLIIKQDNVMFRMFREPMSLELLCLFVGLVSCCLCVRLDVGIWVPFFPFSLVNSCFAVFSLLIVTWKFFRSLLLPARLVWLSSKVSSLQ